MPCYSPIPIRDKTDKRRIRQLIVPCGYCIGCHLERSRVWAVRCVHESKVHRHNCFLTLTISQENLVYGGSEYATLVPEDLQLFFKRFRKRVSKEGRRLRHFSCGEYGDISWRPHYHTCIFGYDFPDKKLYTLRNGNKSYKSKMLEELWPYGLHEISDFSFETAAYVARYCVKKLERKAQGLYVERGIEPEFSRMSLRPAIGLEFFEKFEKDFFRVSDDGHIMADECIIRGKKMRPPRYYWKKFSEKNLVDSKILLDNRIEKSYLNENATNLFRLKAAEKNKHAQIKSLKRQI